MTAAKKTAPATPRVRRQSGTYPIARDEGVPSSNQKQASTGEGAEDRLLAIVAHDLRGPLGAVLGAAHLIARQGDLPDATRRSVDRILRSGERMRRLVELLLEAERARQPGGLPVRVSSARDLRPLVARIVDEVRGEHPDRLILLRAQGPSIAEFDADRVEQVVSNLVVNAVVHGDPIRPVVVGVDADDASAWISVHNEGPPIPPEVLRVLFEPSQRARIERSCSGGLGLGLHIAERIIRAHAGCLSVSSTADSGTRFVASFPRRARR